MLKSETNEPKLSKDSKQLTVFFKGIAILLVILVHSHQKFDILPLFRVVPRFGQMGCQIFFVLSSFGLCHSFLKKQPNWLSYMKKRISKLVVGYWGAIIIYAIYHILIAIVFEKDVLSTLNIPGVFINMLFLNGLIPIETINNNIVRGGWYVGTLVILYAIFPLLYKVYFTDKNKIWKKYRIVLFPLIILCITSIVVIAVGLIYPAFTCKNNSFVYFSFINQLTPFALGLVLFELCNQMNVTKKTFLFSMLSLVVSIVLFYGNFKYSYVFCPCFVALSFVFLYKWFSSNQKVFNTINNSSNIIIRTILCFGKISFPIYLTHSFIVYEFSQICLVLLRQIYRNDLLWYIVLLPIEYCLIYLVGFLYNKCISFIKIHQPKTN